MYQRVKDLREDRGLTQAEFAAQIGLHTTTYARYERGEREFPFDIVIAIAKYYNITLDYIAGLTDTPQTLY